MSVCRISHCFNVFAIIKFYYLHVQIDAAIVSDGREYAVYNGQCRHVDMC